MVVGGEREREGASGVRHNEWYSPRRYSSMRPLSEAARFLARRSPSNRYHAGQRRRAEVMKALLGKLRLQNRTQAASGRALMSMKCSKSPQLKRNNGAECRGSIIRVKPGGGQHRPHFSADD